MEDKLLAGDLVTYVLPSNRVVYAVVLRLHSTGGVLVDRGTDGTFTHREAELKAWGVKKVRATDLVNEINRLSYRELALEKILKGVHQLVSSADLDH